MIDSVKAAEQRLKDYPKMKIAIQNLTDEIAQLQAVLADESIASPRYGEDAIRGGGGELTATEAAAARREHTRERIEELRQRIADLQRQIMAVDRTIAELPSVDCSIVRARMEGLSWWQVGERTGFSERGAQKRHSRALRDIGFMLFGAA